MENKLKNGNYNHFKIGKIGGMQIEIACEKRNQL